MVMTKFIAAPHEGGGETIALLREQSGGLFRRASSEMVPVSEWPRVAPEAGQAALALARALDDESRISEEAKGIVLPPEIVARLDEADAFAIGLPPTTPLTLQLNSGGSLADGTIKVDTKWVRRGGLPVRADIAGARVRGVVTKRFGEKPLKVDAAQLARRQSKLKIDAGADLLFDGQPNIKFEYANPEPSKRMTHLPTGERVQETLARNTVINTR